MGDYVSWGIYGKSHEIKEFYWENDLRALLANENSHLVVGRRRSYGDVCLNRSGDSISSVKFDRIIRFDTVIGEIECCAGLGLDTLNALTVKKGWFVPVSPGTKNVTLGGMVANDVHGKNHHLVGSFGNQLLSLKLLRQGNETLDCSPKQNSDLFRATIGGMGLTGAITHCRFKLKPVQSSVLYVEDLPLQSLSEFQSLSDESDNHWEYTVAWLDAESVKKNSIRGVYSRGKHIEREANHLGASSSRVFSVPITAPNLTLNRLSMRAFNSLYYSLNSKKKESVKTIDSFFYPLDRLNHWNRLYGKRGFYQYQCVLPPDTGIDALYEILMLAKSRNLSPYLTVLKKFGEVLPIGLMSFPMPGYTIAMDFPNLGQRTLIMFNEFDKIVLRCKGRLYAAKDGRMSADTYQTMYTNYQQFTQYLDPSINSNFWQRVSQS